MENCRKVYGDKFFPRANRGKSPSHRKEDTPMRLSLNGVHVPHRKHTAAMPAVPMPAPKTVTMPMVMHIGRPADPIVKVGDHVDVGTLIATPAGAISAPVHASVSGTVKKLDTILLANGSSCPAVVIESDGAMTTDPTLCPPTVASREDFILAVRNSGIVGLGGAGFPTYVKLDVDPSRAEVLIINGAECEPYITSDTRTMVDRAEDMEVAIYALQEHLHLDKIIIGIENNKPEAIRSMKALAARHRGVEVKVLKPLYPQGGEKVLVYHTTGRVIPAGKLPIDVGCIVSNCTTIADIGRYMTTGMPLVSRSITVDGDVVKQPQNLQVPIGTPLEDVFAACGGFTAAPEKVLYGGPMMGIAVPNLQVPVLKNTNAVLAFSPEMSRLPEPSPCISCGSCVNHCPVGLYPKLIEKAYQRGDLQELHRLRVDICMECGCCSYICPANRPLVQTNRLAKAVLRKDAQKQKEKEAGK